MQFLQKAAHIHFLQSVAGLLIKIIYLHLIRSQSDISILNMKNRNIIEEVEPRLLIINL
jgi:hypothetical protein